MPFLQEFLLAAFLLDGAQFLVSTSNSSHPFGSIKITGVFVSLTLFQEDGCVALVPKLGYTRVD